MEIGTSKKEMIERFGLIGEIFCLCAELNEDDDTMDDFKIEWYQFEEELEMDEMFIDIDEEDKNVQFDGIEFIDDMPCVMYVTNVGQSMSCSAIYVETETLRRIIAVLEKYSKVMKS
jgi:hypothetical protein